MKDNLFGNLVLALAIGIVVFFAGVRACESYPFFAQWFGGSCWFDATEEDGLRAGAQHYYLQARGLGFGEHDDEVTKAAIHALAQSGTPKAIATLKEMVQTHPSIDIRKAAMYALAQCADADELVPVYGEIVMHSNMLELRKAAVYALGQSEAVAAVDLLKELALSTEHVAIRKAAVHALQNIESEPARKALYNILTEVSE